VLQIGKAKDLSTPHFKPEAKDARKNPKRRKDQCKRNPYWNRITGLADCDNDDGELCPQPPPVSLSALRLTGQDNIRKIKLKMKNTTFWNIISCHLVGVHRRFWKTRFLHLQDINASQARNE
jgi:hypothetical protein